MKQIFGVILLVCCLAEIPSISSTAVSSSVSYRDKKIPQQIYPVNANGETYGKVRYGAPPSQPEPDLIQARGTNGRIGFVRADDLSSKPRSPTEALAEQRQRKSPRTIPLYDIDGETIIGEFLISDGNVKK